MSTPLEQRKRTSSGNLISKRPSLSLKNSLRSSSNTILSIKSGTTGTPTANKVNKTPICKADIVEELFFSMLDDIVIEMVSIGEAEALTTAGDLPNPLDGSKFVAASNLPEKVRSSSSRKSDKEIKPKIERADSKTQTRDLKRQSAPTTKSKSFMSESGDEKSKRRRFTKKHLKSALPPLSAKKSLVGSSEAIEKKSQLSERSNKSIKSLSSSINLDRRRCFRINFTNGNVYKGTVEKRLMHGHGVFYWKNGAFYEGEFVNGYPTGKGYLQLFDLSKYEGYFCRGYFHGQGTLNICGSPLVYKGNWKFGKKHGHGWIRYDKDNDYEGEWYENEKHGLGSRRYKNGLRYKGYWYHDKRHGQGTALFPNNDVYIGEWKDNYFDGYGEYTWKSNITNSFCLPLRNWYKGTWKNGKRNGVGLMNFGSSGGAILISEWVDNKKHGPGAMICGNGLLLARNPLFYNDNPAKKDYNQSSESERSTNYAEPDINIFNRIFSVISSKKPLEQFDEATVQLIEECGKCISDNQYVYFSDAFKGEIKCSPLQIPLHANLEVIDYRYYIKKILDYRSTLSDSYRNYNPEMLKLENNAVHHLFTRNLTQLLTSYSKYAVFPLNPNGDRSSRLLPRLCFWQFLLDIKVNHHRISLIDVDLAIAENPRCCIQSPHNPFEPIYFWQFLQSLVACAVMVYIKRKFTFFPANQVLSHVIKCFLVEYIWDFDEKNHVGQYLSLYKDIVPMSAAYELYLEVGDAHTVQDFLKKTCIKKGEEMSCYMKLMAENQPKMNIINGVNAVCAGTDIFYTEDDCLKTKQISVHSDDPFFTSLKTFRTLGPHKIVNAIAGVCRSIKDEDGDIIDIHYQLTFLEFMEILLILAVELDFDEAEQRELTQESSTADKKSLTPSGSNVKGRKERKKGSYISEKDKMKNTKLKKKK